MELKAKPPEKISAAVFDLDDTLLVHSELPPESAEALRILHQRGIEIIIATGRALCIVPEAVTALPFVRYFITSNGSFTIDRRSGRVTSRPVSREDALFLLSAVQLYAENVNLHMEDCLITPFHAYARMLTGKSSRIAAQRGGRTSIKNNSRPVWSIKRFVKHANRPIGKLTIHFASSEARSKALPVVDALSGQYEFAVVGGADIEATAKGVDKGSSLVMLCEALGIDVKNTVVFGDSANDIAMFRAAGFGVSIGDSSPELRGISGLAAPSAKEHGALKAVKYLCNL